MSNRGKHVVASNDAGVVLRGRVADEVFVDEASSVSLDLDGTATTVQVDVADFSWKVSD